MNLFLNLVLLIILPIIVHIESKKKNTDFLYDEEFIIVAKQHERVVRENVLFDPISLTTSGEGNKVYAYDNSRLSFNF
jgi:hypothetical protein